MSSRAMLLKHLRAANIRAQGINNDMVTVASGLDDPFIDDAEDQLHKLKREWLLECRVMFRLIRDLARDTL
jgi:hypothetical protein